MKRLKGCLASFLCAMAFASAASAADPQPIKVRLDWNPWSSHAPMFLALQKGWYREAGLDVTIDDGTGSVNTTQMIGTNGSYDVGYATSSAVMMGREKDLPVRIVSVLFRQNDLGLIVPNDSGIAKVADLKGKSLAYTSSSMEAPFIDAFLKSGGLTRKDVDLISLDATAKLSTYAVGRVDSAFAPLPSLMPLIADKRPSHPIKFSDTGLPMPSFCLFASEDTLKAKKDAVSRFVSITSGAWEYIARGHADEAADAMIAQRPQARLNKAILVEGIKTSLDYRGGAAPGLPAGAPVEQDFADAIKTLSAAELLKPAHAPAEFYAPGYVQAALVERVAAK